MKRLLVIFTLFFCITSVYAARTYKIGVFDEQPFSRFHNGKYMGISVTIWKRIAANAEIKYKFIPIKSEDTDDILKLLRKNKLDGIAGPIPVASTDVDKVDFSRPYFINQLGILTEHKFDGFWEILLHILKGFISYTVLIYLAFLLFYTFVYWQLERRSKNEAYLGSRKISFSNALFLTVTLFLTQDVDTSVRSRVSRVLGIIWVMLSILFLSVVVGTITSSLTISQSNLTYTSTDQVIRSFYGLKIAARKSSYAAAIGNILGADITTVKDYKGAIDLLEQKKVSAVIGNYLSLLYLDNQISETKYQLINLGIGSNEVAFAFRKNSPLLDKVNKALTELQEENATYGICARYLGHHNALLCII